MYHICLVSVHGFLCSLDNLNLNNCDTGGQIIYVLNLAYALAKYNNVKHIDIITRKLLLNNSSYIFHNSSNNKNNMKYWPSIEYINDKIRIIRIGLSTDYIHKENIYFLLPELIDCTLDYYNNKNQIPDIWYGHFADGGYVAQVLSSVTDRPFFWSPHSLSLLKDTKEEERLLAEYKSVQNATKIIVSNSITKDILCNLYSCNSSKIYIHPPGISILDNTINEIDNNFYIFNIIKQQNLSIIAAAGRSSKDKYYEALINLFITNPEIKLEFYGIILLIDEYTDYAMYLKQLIINENLTNSICILPGISHYKFQYFLKLLHSNNGIFIHPSKRESFGLVILEAAYFGIPVIVNSNCDITKDLVNNKLKCGIDVLFEDSKTVINEIRRIFTISYNKYSINGINNTKEYSWDGICNIIIETILNYKSLEYNQSNIINIFKNNLNISNHLNNSILVSDFDGTLFSQDIENIFYDKIEYLRKLLTNNKDITYNLIISTGRTLDNLLNTFNQYNIPYPKCLITSVGTQIWFLNNNGKYELDKVYSKHISYLWDRDKLLNIMNTHFPKLQKQEPQNQQEYKLCYYINNYSEWIQYKNNIYKIINLNSIKTQIIQSGGKFIDFIPIRGSKGNAIRYLSKELNIPINDFLVSGDSMNDLEMLNGSCKSIIVYNAYQSLKHALKLNNNIYYSKYSIINGVIEGVQYWINNKQNINICTYCNNGVKHNCNNMIKLQYNEKEYKEYLLPLYSQIKLPLFLINDINGTSLAMKILQQEEYKQYLFIYDEFFLYPDPKMGDIKNINKSNLCKNGFWFISWWIHPDLNCWWNTTLYNNHHQSIKIFKDTWHPSASIQEMSTISKPLNNYLYSIYDIYTNDNNKNKIETFIIKAKEYLSTTFPSNNTIYCVIHFPISPLYSTLHIHFVSGKYFTKYEKQTSKIGRVISLDNISNNFNILSCFICEYHPSKLLLNNISIKTIQDIYKKKNKYLCIICCTSFNTKNELKEHKKVLNHRL